MKEYIDRFVIKPAEQTNSKSKLGIILSSGRFFTNLYTALGFKRSILVNEQSIMQNESIWPLNSKGDKSKAEFTLWISPSGHKYFNFVHGVNYNKCPAKSWTPVQSLILTGTAISNNI